MENNGLVAVVRDNRENGEPKLIIDWYRDPSTLCESALKQVARVAADMILKDRQ